MKASKILKRALALLLGLIVYFSVASPTEAYAAPAASTDQWIITVPSDITAGKMDPNNDKVTISGTWEPSKTVTVTSNAEIPMTCDTIPDIEVTAKVNFPADGLSKHGKAAPVAETISVEEPNVLLGVWTGTINYEVNIEDFAPQSITMITPPDKTKYIEDQKFDPTGMQLKVVYKNGAEETIDVATNDAVTRPTEALKCADTSVTVSYGGENFPVSVTVVPKLIALSATGHKDTYIEGDLFSKANLVVEAIYQKDGVPQEPTTVTGYTFGRDMTAPLQVSDSGTVTVNYVDKDNQPATTNIAITVNPKLKSIAVTGGDRSYIEGEPFNPEGVSVDVTYTENGETKTKTVTYPNDRISVPGNALTTANDKVTLTYTEYGQSVEQDVSVTVIPKLDSLVISGTYDTAYYENQTFNPTGMTVQAKYIRNGAEELVDLSLDDLTFSPSTSDLLTLTNNEVTITYVDANDQTVTAVIPITVTIPPVPTLAAERTWFDASGYTDYNQIKTITTINIVKSYTPSGNETLSWPAAVDGDGDGELDSDIMCYLEGTTLTIAGNGRERINANANSHNAFYLFTGVTSITGLNILDTSNVTNMNYMFDYCKSLTSLDLNNFNTDNVTNMFGMFRSCESLTSLDLSSFNTEKVISIGSMFSGCKKLTSLDLSHFDTKNIDSMWGLFSSCAALKSLDISTWDTSKIYDFQSTFYGCKALTTLDLSHFVPPSGKRVLCSAMFRECSNLTSVDLSGFGAVTFGTSGTMFYDCKKLTTIYASDTMTPVDATESDDVFQNCGSLVGEKGTRYSYTHMDGSYARIDDPANGQPGYFTYKAPKSLAP